MDFISFQLAYWNMFTPRHLYQIKLQQLYCPSLNQNPFHISKPIRLPKNWIIIFKYDVGHLSFQLA